VVYVLEDEAEKKRVSSTCYISIYLSIYMYIYYIYVYLSIDGHVVVMRL